MAHPERLTPAQIEELTALHPQLLALFTDNWQLQSKLAAATARAEQAEARSQWQPMETAPKDETRVLLWWPEIAPRQPCIGRFSAGWWETDSRYSDPSTPSGWQPLPCTPPRPVEGSRP